MAITIRSRKGTQIGYRGTTGGSLSWINQDGQAGRQIAATGSQMIRMADDVKKLFDDEVTESEIRQQVDQMQVSYLKQSRSWLKDMKQGGVGTDENGVPLKDLDPYFFTNISEQHHKSFWEDNVTGKGFDPKAVDAFGVWFESKAQESYAKADQWGTKQRYARLNARDDVTVREHLITIQTDPSIENKQTSFEALESMQLAGAPHRNPDAWRKIVDNAKQDLIVNTAIEHAYNQQGKNPDPSDLTNGYTVNDYSQAIKSINENETLTKTQKEKIIKSMASNRKTRLAVEKDAQAAADNAIQNEFSRLHSQNKLTLAQIENSSIDYKQKMYWKKQLEGGTKKPWKGDYNALKSQILSGTWAEENDVVRKTNMVRQAVLKEAMAKGIPSDDIEKLMKDVTEVAKDSPITAKKKAALSHAKNVFNTKLSAFARLLTGQQNAGVLVQEAQAAADNNLPKFGIALESRLEEGRKNGITWDRMLTPGTNEYIVNDIIDDINKVEPEAVDVPEVEEEPGFVESVIEGYKEDFHKLGEFLWGEGDPEGVTYEIYGTKNTFKEGVTYEHAKAQVDSQYAQETYGNPMNFITYPKEHPAYDQYENGVETIEAWEKRMQLMGYEIK